MASKPARFTIANDSRVLKELQDRMHQRLLADGQILEQHYAPPPD
jgi:hypothetical protein